MGCFFLSCRITGKSWNKRKFLSIKWKGRRQRRSGLCSHSWLQGRKGSDKLISFAPWPGMRPSYFLDQNLDLFYFFKTCFNLNFLICFLFCFVSFRFVSFCFVYSCLLALIEETFSQDPSPLWMDRGSLSSCDIINIKNKNKKR